MDISEDAAAGWEDLKEEIRDLYINKDMSLEKVRSVMKSRHQFEASKSQYETQLKKKWGFRKYLKEARPGDLRTIGRAFMAAKRRAGDGSPEPLVIHSSNLQRPVTARTLKRRGAIPPLMEKRPEVYSRAESPEAPPDITIQFPNRPQVSLVSRAISSSPGLDHAPNFAEFFLRASKVAQAVEELDLPFQLQDGNLTLPITSSGAVKFLDAACPKLPVQTLYRIDCGTGVLNNVGSKLSRELVHACVVQNNVEMAMHLISLGMDVNAVTSANDTALNAAIRIKHKPLIAQLCVRGVSPFVRGKKCDCGYDPYSNALVAAAEVDLQECINSFLKSMVHNDINSFGTLSHNYMLDPSRFCRCATPLTAAILAGHTGLVSVLLSKGARPENPVWAAQEGQVSLRRISPLAASVLANNFAAATSLLEAGVNPVDNDAITATSGLKESGLHFIELFAIALRRRGRSDKHAWSLLLDSTIGHFPQAGAPTALEQYKKVLALMLRSNCAAINGCEDFQGYPPSPLYTVLSHGFLDLVPVLAGAGASYNSPLWYKAGKGDKENLQRTSALRMAVEKVCGLNNDRAQYWVTFLLDAGARDLDDAAHIMPSTLVELSVRNKTTSVTELLLSRGYEFGTSPFPGSCRTALQYATEQGDLDTVEMLLRYGGDPNIYLSGTEKDLRTPLQIAVQMQRLDIIHSLLKWGAKVNKQGHTSLATPLQLAAKLGAHDIMTTLLNNGANVNERLDSSWLRFDDSDPTNPAFLSPLQIAVCYNHSHIIKLLLKFKADVDGRSSASDLTNPKISLLEARHTPLQLAVNRGNFKAIDILLGHDANVNADAHPQGGATALQYAARRGFIHVARRLLLKGANINAPGAIKDGRTALEGAAENGELEMVRLLLDCPVNIYDLDFHRALLRAESNTDEDIKTLLNAVYDRKAAEGWERHH
ncbi:ankyrin repeat-containing domain protein [Cladorrhinum sp. PSN259]|nr:ankyrin repeat-containing domain protein [Cladorrhinum sp. PSN259]